MQTQKQGCMMEHSVFPNPSIFIDLSIEKGPVRFQIDRSCQCGHFGLCTSWETSFFLSKLAGGVGFYDLIMIFCQWV